MARTARIILPGKPHHVLQRGAAGETVFYEDIDRTTYLEHLARCAEEEQLDILAYCLLENRVHLVAVPKTEDSLAMTLRRTHSFYSRWLNAHLGRSGNVWGGRFMSSPLDNEWMLKAIRYVERLPVVETNLRKAERYAWSSAAAHCGQREDDVLSKRLSLAKEVPNWSKWLAEKQPEEETMALARTIKRNQAIGSPQFLGRLEKKFGRNVGPKPIGRPRKR
ncbi:transposase [bacterium]|nr:transposase [bacterium]